MTKEPPVVTPIKDDAPIRQVTKRWTAFTDERKQAFLDAMEQRGDKTLAAAQAGVHVRTINDHLRQDPEFQRLFTEAYDSFKANLEDVAQMRSWTSDRILELVLKRHIREYREKVEIDQRTTTLPPPDRIDVSALTPEQKDALMVLLGAAPSLIDAPAHTAQPDDGPEQPEGVPEASETPEDQPG